MEKKFVLTSKEIWVIFLGILNSVLNSYGFPSFEPTPELYTTLLGIIAILRIWFTKSAVTFRLK